MPIIIIPKVINECLTHYGIRFCFIVYDIVFGQNDMEVRNIGSTCEAQLTICIINIDRYAIKTSPGA